MAYQTLDLGTSADDGTGDSLRVGGDKINDNFSELYTLLGNGSILTTGLSVSGAIITLSEAVGTFTTLTPPSADGASLGSAALEWSDLYLYDSSVIYFGINSDITLTHVPDVGLRLKSVATADDKPIVLTLQTGETDIAASDVLGKIEFQAPDEGTGTDAILVAAHIAAISEGDFSASNNATKLSFATGASEAASEKMSLSSAGVLTTSSNIVSGGTITGGGLLTTGGNIVIPNAGTIGSVGDTDAIAISSGGVVTFSATPVFSGDSTFADDVSLTSDAAVLSFGENSEVTLTHVHNVGLTLTHTGTGDNLPVVLQLKSEEDVVVADEVIASLEFAAGDSDGTDGATVAAGIHAIAEGAFSATANATKLVFTTGVSETAAASATAKMTLSSAGLLTIADDFMIKDGGTIGVASTADALTISSAGLLTVKDDLVIKTGGTIGGANDTDLLTLTSAVLTVAGEVVGTGFTGTLDGVLGGGTPAAASVTTLTTTGNIVIPNAGTIGSAGDADSIAIASNGVVTFSQIPVMPANSIDSDEYIDGSIDTAHIADNQITLAKMAGGTDGNLITYDASGDPAFVATGTDGQVLTSAGSGAAPVFETLVAFPSGTRMVFQQTAAPTGWTKDTTAALNDGSLRTTTGTVGTGGTVAFETAFASQAVGGTNGNTGATTLSTAQLPSHTHGFGAPNQTAGLQGGQQGRVGDNGGGSVTGATGGGGSHIHGGSTFSGTAIDLNVKFYDVIIAAKD